MGDESSNVNLLKEAYAKWRASNGTSGDHWRSICAGDIKFSSLAKGPEGAAYLTGYTNRDALKEYFDGIARDWEMVDFVTEHFVAQGDRVVMIGHCAWRYRKNGLVVSTPKVDCWRFANGVAVEFQELYDTAQVKDVASVTTRAASSS